MSVQTQTKGAANIGGRSNRGRRIRWSDSTEARGVPVHQEITIAVVGRQATSPTRSEKF